THAFLTPPKASPPCCCLASTPLAEPSHGCSVEGHRPRDTLETGKHPEDYRRRSRLRRFLETFLLCT
ncbi:hypothetical protein KUCAC02_035951, partial [Chaenocephalus aceratus]